MSISLWQIEKHRAGRPISRKKVVARYGYTAALRGYGYESRFDEATQRWFPDRLNVGDECTIIIKRLKTGRTTQSFMQELIDDRVQQQNLIQE
jgi:hypothetical protein